MKLTGRDGILRIYDSAIVAHGTAPLDSLTPDVVTFDGTSTWANITAAASADDTSYANDFLPTSAGMVFIGSTSKFAMIKFLKGGGANYAAGAGALIAKYFDGTDFDSLLTGVVDGTAVAANCFAQDGNITFKVPRDWAIGANAYNANLDADKYYVCLMTTTSSNPDADADMLIPVDGQYFDVKFAGMDFNGPIGRALTEEQLVLNRQRVDAYGHYIEGPDDKLFEPLPLSFSCLIDDTYNKDMIMEALECDNPNTLTWTATGTTAKASTKNDGTNANPAFADTNKKAVNVQMQWAGTTYGLAFAYYEVYFPPEAVTITEGEDGITLAAQGGVYGVIEQIHGLGNRY